jgi:hypothetical protein
MQRRGLHIAAVSSNYTTSELSEAMVDASADSSPWLPKAQLMDTGHNNICYDGKQVPDFYVLGVQKCATTTLSDNLIGAGMSHVHGDKNPKEFHWFDHRMDFLAHGIDGFHTNKAKWLEWMPPCPKADSTGMSKRSVLADFTPDYLRVVPRPSHDFKLKGDWLKAQSMDAIAPRYLHQLYGIKSPKVTFAIMIREPLSQLQSAWYHAASFNFTNACKSCAAVSFKAALSSLVDGLKRSPPELTPWLWTAMYGRHLDSWLKYFDHSQFYLTPMHQLSAPNKDTICIDLKKRLDFNADCSSKGVQSPHSWHHEHPSVNADAGELRNEFDKLMTEENSRLVRLLAKSNTKGLGLANYQGEAGSEADVKAWLESSW